ncbi:MAG: tetratricopeptide repeat protein [Bacteroidota bacterium]
MISHSTILSTIILFCTYFTSSIVHATIRPQIDEQLTVIKGIVDKEPKSALSMINILLSDKKLSEAEQGELYYQRGLIEYKRLHEKDQSILSFYKALRHFRHTQNTERQYHTLSYLGTAHRILERNNYALEYFQEILELGLSDRKKLLLTKYNIAKSLRMLEAYDSAIQTQTRLSGQFREMSMTKWEINSLLEIGLNHIDLENWQSARESYQKASDLIATSSSNSTRYQAKVLGSLGFISLQEGEYEEAQSYFQKATPLMIQENDLSILAIHYNDMALLETKKGNQDQALIYLKKSVALDPKQAGASEIKNALVELVKIYKSENQGTLALLYSERLNDIAVPYIKLSKELEKQHKQYLADRVHYVIKEFELSEALHQERERKLIAFFIGFLILLVTPIIAYLWYKKKSNKDQSFLEFLIWRLRLLHRYCIYNNITMAEMERRYGGDDWAQNRK